MNLLIVDDEPIIRIGLRTLVNWDEHGLTLVGEAADGKEALEKIRGLEVDILVTDIRMPRMDGLELIRNARLLKDDLGVLVLSCLDDFAFVREAMKLGASDYLLKPAMEPEELVQILLSIKRKIGQEREAKRQLAEWQAQLRGSKQHRLSARMKQFIETEYPDEELERELFREHLVMFSLLVVWSAPGRSTLDDIEFDGCAARFHWRDRAVVLLFPDSASLSKQEQHRERFAQAGQVAAKLSRAIGTSAAVYFICIGAPAADLRGLRQALERHENQWHRQFYNPVKTIVWEEAAPPSTEPALPYEQRVDLLKAVAHQNADSLFHQAEILMQFVLTAQPHVGRLQSFLFELLVSAVGTAREYGYANAAEFEQRYVSLDRIKSFLTAADLCRWLMAAFHELWNGRWNISHEGLSANPFIRKALLYMKEHYHRNIGTVDIAGHVKLSRSYLSDLFGKETGESLIEALTRIRIDEAKRRLASGERKIYEVAAEVGFTDAKTFAKTFKRIVGCTPKEFEARQLAP